MRRTGRAALDKSIPSRIYSVVGMVLSEDRPKKERLQVFYDRLQQAPAAKTFDEAYRLIADTMTAVEDELTSIPNNPNSWQNDQRLYPPLADSVRDVPGKPNLKRFRSFRHNTFIAQNGAIEIKTLSGSVEFSKVGNDGRGVWDT